MKYLKLFENNSLIELDNINGIEEINSICKKLNILPKNYSDSEIRNGYSNNFTITFQSNKDKITFLTQYKNIFRNKIIENTSNKLVIQFIDKKVDYVTSLIDQVTDYLIDFTDIGYYLKISKGYSDGDWIVHYNKSRHITALGVNLKSYNDDDDDYTFDPMQTLKKNQVIFNNNLFDMVNKFMKKIRSENLKIRMSLYNGIDLEFQIVHEKDPKFIDFDEN